MKKILYILCLVLCSSFFVLADDRYPFMITSVMKYGDASCYVNGQVIVPVTTDKSVIYLSSIKFIIAVDNTTGKVSYLTGTWYDDNFQVTTIVQQGKKANFVSDEYLLNDRSKYDVHLSLVPLQVLSMLENSNTLKYTVTCPGYKHSCKFINLKIDSCYSDLDNFYTHFHGIGGLNYSKVDLKTDVDYLLNYIGLDSSSSLPKSSVVHELGNDSYVLIIPRKDLKQRITSIKLHIKDCNEQVYQVATFAQCGFVNVSANLEPHGASATPHLIPKPTKIPEQVQNQSQNQTSQVQPMQKPEHIDFVYRILNFFKRLFGMRG